MEVVRFSTGRVRPKRAARGVRRYFRGGWAERTLPVNVFAVEHPAGLCLFDTGQTARAAEPGYFPRWHPFMRLSRFELTHDDETAPQLRAAGLEPDQVRWVVLSHLHTDHMGGLEAFRGAEVVVSRIEWERAQGFRGQMRGYLPQRWPAGIEPRPIELSGPAVGPFPGSHDLAGDGRLLLVPTPTHTPGHISLLLRNGESSFCAGDLAHSWQELEETAPAVARWLREERVTLLATHDDAAPERIREREEVA